MTKPYTVIVLLEAKLDKVVELKQLLTDVSEHSRKEDTCLVYRLHQDLSHASKFILYECWVDQNAHERQFQKPYIISLGEKIGDLLAEPYKVIFAQEV